jgi:hypothetical protein
MNTALLRIKLSGGIGVVVSNVRHDSRCAQLVVAGIHDLLCKQSAPRLLPPALVQYIEHDSDVVAIAQGTLATDDRIVTYFSQQPFLAVVRQNQHVQWLPSPASTEEFVHVCDGDAIVCFVKGPSNERAHRYGRDRGVRYIHYTGIPEATSIVEDLFETITIVTGASSC